jgi:hypothetical protein
MAVSLATEIDRWIRTLPDQRTEPIRRIRREYSKRLRKASGGEMLRLADELVPRQRWVVYELLHHHPDPLSMLDVERIERLGRGMDSWRATDPFGRYVSGPAWQQDLISDEAVHRWAARRIAGGGGRRSYRLFRSTCAPPAEPVTAPGRWRFAGG